MSEDYFEGQSNKDCVIHSFNNAFGTKVLTKEDVLAYINKKISQKMAQFALTLSNAELAQKERMARARYSSGKTFFAADIVWECGKSKGAYKVHTSIPGFSTPYLRMDVMTPVVLAHPIVMLGGNNSGGTHAVAVRNGKIYDSERKSEGPRPLTRVEVKKSLPKVFGAYAFLNDPADVIAIRRTASVVKSYET